MIHSSLNLCRLAQPQGYPIEYALNCASWSNAAWYKFEEERLIQIYDRIVLIFSQRGPRLVTCKAAFGMALKALGKIYHIFIAEKREG